MNSGQSDPLTQNRYNLAASNPLSAIEWDGHVIVAPPSGGAAPSPTPTPTPTTIPVGCSRGCPPAGSAPSSGGGFLSNVWHGFANWVVSTFTAPAANVVGNVYRAGGGMYMAQNPTMARLGNPAEGSANRVIQFGARPIPGGDPSSFTYKLGYYGPDVASLALGGIGMIGRLRGIGMIGKLRELLAAEGGAAQAARTGLTFTTDSAGDTAVSLRTAAGDTFRYSNHALQRLTERGVSLDQASTLLGDSSKSFPYFHDDVWKIGFYDPSSRLFIVTLNGDVTTVIYRKSFSELHQ
jgi:hypothetical protein